jgi:hypothetical protein
MREKANPLPGEQTLLERSDDQPRLTPTRDVGRYATGGRPAAKGGGLSPLWGPKLKSQSVAAEAAKHDY